MTDHTADVVAAALTSTTPQAPAPPTAGARRVVDATASLFELDPSDLLYGTSRARRETDARMVAMTVIRATTAMSYPEIGRFLGRDHSTVMNGVKRVLSCPTRRAWAAAVHEALNQPELPLGGPL